jgi:hypothetical protein
MIWLAAPAFAADEADQLRGHLDQARFFVKKQWYEDARKELEAAVALPDGRIDPEAWYLLATVRYELCDVEGARAAAARAHSYSRDDEQLQLAATLNAFLAEQFGIVEVRAPYAGLTGSLSIEAEGPLLDPNLKLYVERLRKLHGGKILFPVRVALPVGPWKVNGRSVTVEPNGNLVLEMDAAEIAGGRAATAQLAKAELGLGMGFWLGEDVENVAPGLQAELSLSQPVGPLVIGALWGWSPASWDTIDGSHASSLAAWSGGVRVGFELGADHLLVRPSLGWRYAYVPGIERACTDDAGGWSCSADGPKELVVYGVGRAQVPFVELSVDWLDNTRKSGLGLGVKMAGERAFGTLPATATADLDGGSVGYSVAEDSRSWSATGVRALLNLSLAF